METSWGKDEQCPAAPVPNTAPTTVGYRASCCLAHSPRSGPPAWGFTCVRCCGSPPASIPHALTGKDSVGIMPSCLLVQLPLARGCLRQAPQRTCTPNRSSMPSAPGEPDRRRRFPLGLIAMERRLDLLTRGRTILPRQTRHTSSVSGLSTWREDRITCATGPAWVEGQSLSAVLRGGS